MRAVHETVAAGNAVSDARVKRATRARRRRYPLRSTNKRSPLSSVATPVFSGRNVDNLSGVAREEAEAFLQREAAPCARFFRCADGTVLTSDCPVGLRRSDASKPPWRRESACCRG